MLDLIERSVRSAWTARSPVLYLGNKLVYLMYTIWKRDEQAGVRPGLRIALRALHRSEASGLRRPRRGVGERSRDLFGRGDDLPHQTMARVHEVLLGRAIEARFMDPRHRLMWHLVATPEEVPAALADAPAAAAEARRFAARSRPEDDPHPV